MSLFGLALLAAPAVAAHKARVASGEVEPIIPPEARARMRARARRALEAAGEDGDEVAPVVVGDDPYLDDLYWRACDRIGWDPVGSRSGTLAQYVMDLVDTALFEDELDEDEEWDEDDWAIAGKSDRQQRRRGRQQARTARKAQRQDAKTARKANRQANRQARQTQRQEARAGRQASRQEWRQKAGEGIRRGLGNAAKLVQYGLNPAKPLTDWAIDKLDAAREKRDLEKQLDLDAMEAAYGRGQELEDAYHAGDLAAAYSDADAAYADEGYAPEPIPPSDAGGYSGGGGGGGGGGEPSGYDQGGYDYGDTYSEDYGDDYDTFEDYSDDSDDYAYEVEEGEDSEWDDSDWSEAEDLGDYGSEDPEEDEYVEELSISADPGELAEAAMHAVRLAQAASKRRKLERANDQEPSVSLATIAALKAAAKVKIAAARRAASRQTRRDINEDADEEDWSIEGDRKTRRKGRRPPTGRRPFGERGAVLWGDEERAGRPQHRPRGGPEGVSLLDVGVDPTQGVRLELEPVTLAEAAELLLAITRVNVAQLQDGMEPISMGIEDGRVRYGRPDVTTFATIRDIWASGVADCAPLSAAIAAERTLAGHPSVPYLYYASPGVIHAVVRDLKTGDLFDPSRAAGMGSDL